MGNEDIEEGLLNFLDTRKRGSENLYTSKLIGGGGGRGSLKN